MTEQDDGAVEEERVDSGLEAATRRLDLAMSRLEAKLAERVARIGDTDAFAEDRARLAADLDAARAREKALEQVAAEASAALGRAAAEVRAALAAELADELAGGIEAGDREV